MKSCILLLTILIGIHIQGQSLEGTYYSETDTIRLSKDSLYHGSSKRGVKYGSYKVYGDRLFLTDTICPVNMGYKIIAEWESEDPLYFFVVKDSNDCLVSFPYTSLRCRNSIVSYQTHRRAYVVVNDIPATMKYFIVGANAYDNIAVPYKVGCSRIYEINLDAYSKGNYKCYLPFGYSYLDFKIFSDKLIIKKAYSYSKGREKNGVLEEEQILFENVTLYRSTENPEPVFRRRKGY